MEMTHHNGSGQAARYLVFAVDDHLFAIKVSNVLGIIQIDKITPIPRSTPSILGVTKMRGEICTVVDMCAWLFHKDSCKACTEGSLLAISIEYERRRICAVVQEVVSVIEIDSEEIRSDLPASTVSNRISGGYVLVSGKPIQILSEC